MEYQTTVVVARELHAQSYMTICGQLRERRREHHGIELYMRNSDGIKDFISLDSVVGLLTNDVGIPLGTAVEIKACGEQLTVLEEAVNTLVVFLSTPSTEIPWNDFSRKRN